MTTLAVERLSDLTLSPEDWQQAFGMLEAHYKEVATFKHLLKLNPDLPRYQQLEREERLHIVIMREGSAIVGYSVHVIANGLLHYRNVRVADDDVHYLMPHLRGTGEHARMRRFAMQTLKARGVQLITARSRFGHEHDKAIKDIGFEPWDLVYACDLTQWEPPSEG
jgi:hypothetical protein